MSDNILDSLGADKGMIVLGGAVGGGYLASKDLVTALVLGAGVAHFNVGGAGDWAAENLGIDIRKKDSSSDAVIDDGNGDDDGNDPNPDPGPEPDPDPEPVVLTPEDVVDAETAFRYHTQVSGSHPSEWLSDLSSSVVVVFKTVPDLTANQTELYTYIKHPSSSVVYPISLGWAHTLCVDGGYNYALIDNSNGVIRRTTEAEAALNAYGNPTPFAMLRDAVAAGQAVTASALRLSKDGGVDVEKPVLETAEDVVVYYEAQGVVPNRTNSTFDTAGVIRFLLNHPVRDYNPSRSAKIQVMHPEDGSFMDINVSQCARLMNKRYNYFAKVDGGAFVPSSDFRSLISDSLNGALPGSITRYEELGYLLASDMLIPLDKYYDMNLLATGVLPVIRKIETVSEYSADGITILFDEGVEWTAGEFEDDMIHCQSTRNWSIKGTCIAVAGLWPGPMRLEALKARRLSREQICEALWQGLPLTNMPYSSASPRIEHYDLATYATSPTYREESRENDVSNYVTLSGKDVYPIRNCIPR